jgi:CRP/FNR family cyclic AMP-dependent transcriptional regulator
MLAVDSIELFRGLAPSTFALLEDSFTRVSYSRGASFVLEGDAAHRVYVLLTGLCRVSSVSPEGREVTFEILGAGSLIGELSLTDGASRSASVECLDHVTLASWPTSRFKDVLLHDSELCCRLLEVVARRLRKADSRIVELTCSTAKRRVLGCLLRLAEDHGRRGLNGEVTTPFRLTQADIAKLAGVSRETCTSVLQELSQQNVYWSTKGAMGFDVRALARM